MANVQYYDVILKPVITEKSEPVIFLLEGVYGLYVLIPIVFLLSMFSLSCHR